MKKIAYIRLSFGFLLVIFLSSCSCYERRFTKSINMVLERDDMPYSDKVIDNVFSKIERCPSSLGYQFDDWDDVGSRIAIATSDDGMVRAYTIDRFSFSGNPANDISTRTLVQYRCGKKVCCFEFEDDDYGVVKSITKIEDGRYMFEYSYSRIGDNQLSLYVYNLSKRTPDKISYAFKIGTALCNSIDLYWQDYGYDEDGNEEKSVYICDDYEDEESVFLYNRSSKTLYVSNTSAHGAGYVLLDGTYSEYKWDYGCFERIFPTRKIDVRNDDYYISIVLEEDGTCIYRSWNNGVKKGIPHLIIYNGIMQYWSYDGTLIDYNKWVADDESTPLGEKYTFTNNGYRYEYHTGWWHGAFQETLYVYSPTEETLYAKEFEKVYD